MALPDAGVTAPLAEEPACNEGVGMVLDAPTAGLCEAVREAGDCGSDQRVFFVHQADDFPY